MKRPLCGIFAGSFLMVFAGFGPNAFAGNSSHSLEVAGLKGLTPVPESELSSQSGRQGLDLLQMNDSDPLANIDNNQIKGTINSGRNMVDNGSFAGSVGFTTSIQNSGNNVVIQDNTLVNIIFNQ